MPLSESKSELLTFVKEKHEKLSAVVMPDFFYDRLLSIKSDPIEIFSLIQDVARRKGGSIDGISQMEIRGGNAVNTASALAALGVNVTPIICSDKAGFQLLKYYLRESCIDFSHIKIVKHASLTTALEFRTKFGKTNVMLRDLGSLSNFGPLDLTDNDYEAIEKADFVCVFNWAGTRNFGTALAKNVFRRIKTKGRGKTYYDTADPTPNKSKIPELVKNVLKTNLVDVLSLNENEAISYASIFDGEIFSGQEKQTLDTVAIKAARVLSKHLTARIDLHTTSFSATITKQREVIVPSFKINPLRATGAGDAWNAGNIFGDVFGLSDTYRLTLANAVSAYYLSNANGKHPTHKQLCKFIEKSDFNIPFI